MSDPISEVLRQFPVHKETDPAIQRAVAGGNADVFRTAFSKRLTKVRKRLDKVYIDSFLVSAYGWSFASLAERNSSLPSLVRAANEVVRKQSEQKKRRRAVAEHLAGTFETDVSARLYSLVVSVEMLVRYSDCFEPDQLVLLCDRLIHLDTLALSEDVQAACPLQDHAGVDVLLTAELPYCLSLLLEPFVQPRNVRDRCCQKFASVLEAAADSDGTPHAGVARHIDLWLGTFVRAAGMARGFKAEWAEKFTLKLWKQFVERSALLLTADGFITLHANPECGLTDSLALLKAAIAVAGVSSSSAAHRVMTSLSGIPEDDRKKAKKHGRTADDVVHGLSDQSDWAAAALLRNSTGHAADVVSVDWDCLPHTFSLSARGSLVFSGGWASEVRVDGEAACPTGDWVCTCWFEDDEAAFVELECGTDTSVRHVRHVLLTLRDHCALLVDTVTAAEPASSIAFESRLSCANGFTFEANTITRDLLVQRDRRSLRAIPVWLADDRIQSTSGDMTGEDNRLVLKAEGAGGVCVPLLLDWHPDRQTCDADWSRLTVTERRTVVAPRDAAGFRVRSDRLQLLMFRSLRRGEFLRAVLGHHTGNETVYGRIENSGKIAPIVLVESHV